ncbi:hypothetical protein A9Q96_04930 [Rhodobacterales bacterium 52_120_T64]|nr:hypothetical protein A9Q96_04930 [Rhodobacterales bacterium 52_120_T64]
MTITLSEACTCLVSGTALSWEATGAYKAGSIHLDNAAQRRLFKYLIEQDQDKVSGASESLFDGLTAAWLDVDVDPANDGTNTDGHALSGPWRLKRITATGFGGLNISDGPAFELDVNSENWCIEGYNGSGKTSLASIILWTLTGYRNREQDGPFKDIGRREIVTNGTKKIGTWPPLVTYPHTPEDLNKTARVSATLTFEDPSGLLATATRTIESPVEGDPIVNEKIDPRVMSSPELIETGLLMPARIGHIGFGTKSQSLYQALKMLTGLDQLTAIGAGAAAFGHGAKRFQKYGRDNGIEGFKKAFVTCLDRAREESTNTSIDLTKNYRLGDKNLLETLTAIEEAASDKAGKTLAILKAEITDDIDVTNANDRKRLNDGISKARVYVGEGHNGVPLFKAWGALKLAGDAGFSEINEAIETAKASLETALGWHSKQQSDKKLRLKALAAKFFVSEGLLEEKSHCPLCETKFTSAEQLELADELAGLKADSEHAERGIADACGDIERILLDLTPEPIKVYFDQLSDMNPSTAFATALRKRFFDQAPFCDVLIGIGAFTASYADQKAAELPSFEPPQTTFPPNSIVEVERLQELIVKMVRISELTAWWGENRTVFLAAWKGLIGEKDADNKWPMDSLEGKLQSLEDAIAGSKPLDIIAKQMKAAKGAAESWASINSVQKMREAIATALEPLKSLQQLVEGETHRTVVTLEDKVAAILDEIRLKDRLSFEGTAMSKKSVTVEGSFALGMKFDAAHVANSSWLRAILWAFIFALREQAISDLGCNTFPLMVLDDPQTTFDPKNKRKWATKMVEMANSDRADAAGIQLFLTTHERQFFDIICETCELVGQEGKMAGPTSSTKVAHIVNGTFLDRQFAKASKDGDDEEGFRYVLQVRAYCEDLLRIMLRPESYEISGDTLGKLCELLAKLNKDELAPFNRGVFVKLLNLLNEKQVPIIKVINAPHHTFDGTIGYAQAQDVQKYWKGPLQKAFVNAFRLAADFDAYNGVSRLFAWEDNVIEFPDGHKDKIKSLGLPLTGVAAAAETDGLVGDGQIQIEEWDKSEKITLFAHNAYRLNAGTLDPIAGIGDIILVQDHPKPRSRNLIVTALGEKLYARRLNDSNSHPDVVMLTAQATDPYTLPEPIIALKSNISPRKIVGTLFMGSSLAPPKNDGNEVCAVDDFSIVETRMKNATLFRVKGRSMEPVALENQYVMTIDETLDQATLKRLNGELVIAVDEDAGVYFKRLRLHGSLIVLESANSSASTASEVLSLSDSAEFKKILNIKSVVGVLFDLPASN